MAEEKKKIETREEKAKRLHDRDINDIRTVIAIPEGRRLFWRILEYGRLWRADFQESVKLLYFEQGKKNTASIFLNDLLEAKSDVFIQMQREHASEAKREELEDDKRREKKEENILELNPDD